MDYSDNVRTHLKSINTSLQTILTTLSTGEENSLQDNTNIEKLASSLENVIRLFGYSGNNWGINEESKIINEESKIINEEIGEEEMKDIIEGKIVAIEDNPLEEGNDQNEILSEEFRELTMGTDLFPSVPVNVQNLNAQLPPNSSSSQINIDIQSIKHSLEDKKTTFTKEIEYQEKLFKKCKELGIDF